MYEKQTWVNGEVITDTKLNHMEDGIVNASGFSVETETRVLVPEQNFIAQLDVDYYVAQLSNVQLNGESPIKVVFDGTEYTCNAVPEGPTVYYGDYDFVEYPFALSAYQGTCYIDVADGNQHTISASVENEVVTASEDFKKAVIDTTGGGSDSDIFLVKVTASGSDANPTFTADKTLQEVAEAFSNKKLVMTNEGYVYIGGSAGFSRTYVSGTALVSDMYMYYMDEEDDDPSPDETRLEKTTEVFQLQPLV